MRWAFALEVEFQRPEQEQRVDFVSFATSWSRFVCGAAVVRRRVISFVCSRVHVVGLTKVSYEQMNRLYDTYGDKGFTVLAFPCGQVRQRTSLDSAMRGCC